MTARQKVRDRIEQALADLPWVTRSTLRLDTNGTAGQRTLAGLLADAFMPELARSQDAADTVARVRSAVAGLPVDGSVPVRTILDALHGQEQTP